MVVTLGNAQQAMTAVVSLRARSFAPAAPRAAWDVTPLAVPPTGIGYYLRESFRAAAAIAPQHELVALSVAGKNGSVRLAGALAALPPNASRRHLRIRGAGPVPFSFDFSFNFYPLAYERPGPVMQVWRLKGGRCAGLSSS